MRATMENNKPPCKVKLGMSVCHDSHDARGSILQRIRAVTIKGTHGAASEYHLSSVIDALIVIDHELVHA